MIPTRRKSHSKMFTGRLMLGIILYGGVGLLVIFFVMPFFWAISSSFKTVGEIYSMPPQWIPEKFHPENYVKAWVDYLPFTTFLINTCIVAFFVVLGRVFVSALVAYGFARFRFPGRNFLFLIVLSTTMIPWTVLIIPQFLLFNYLGWINTLKPLFVPFLFGIAGFDVFLLRQFFMTIPRELDDAAAVDGCSSLRFFVFIMLPLSKPVLATVAIFAFIFSWNQFIHPLIYLQSMEKLVLGVGLYIMELTTSAEIATKPVENLVMAVAVLITVPLIVVFFFCQKYFVRGITWTGIKG